MLRRLFRNSRNLARRCIDVRQPIVWRYDGGGKQTLAGVALGNRARAAARVYDATMRALLGETIREDGADALRSRVGAFCVSIDALDTVRRRDRCAREHCRIHLKPRRLKSARLLHINFSRRAICCLQLSLMRRGRQRRWRSLANRFDLSRKLALKNAATRAPRLGL